MSTQRILVTGGAGYIGSTLSAKLLKAGHEVTVLDRFFFGDTLAHISENSRLHVVKGDVRTCDLSVLEGIDVVMDLAALSNDPAGELNPDITMAINFLGRSRIARAAKERGVNRYILASSCSVYGFSEEILDEASHVNPLTTYARANLQAEHSCLELASDEFVVVVLRQATVYGLSPRMRFDLAVNGMTLGFHRDGEIPVLRDGTQWRPMVHVDDTSQAFVTMASADPSRVNREIFNVGSDEQNFQILPLAEQIAGAIGKPFAFRWYGDPDRRSYRVSFKKIRDAVGYMPSFTPADAAREIHEALESGSVSPDVRTRTVEWYKNLINWHGVLQEVTLDGVLF